jgi:cysteine desulfurase
MGCTAARARSSIRFSLGIYNTDEEVEYALKHLPGIIAKLRANSPMA